MITPDADFIDQEEVMSELLAVMKSIPGALERHNLQTADDCGRLR